MHKHFQTFVHVSAADCVSEHRACSCFQGAAGLASVCDSGSTSGCALLVLGGYFSQCTAALSHSHLCLQLDQKMFVHPSGVPTCIWALTVLQASSACRQMLLVP